MHDNKLIDDLIETLLATVPERDAAEIRKFIGAHREIMDRVIGKIESVTEKEDVDGQG